MEEQIIDNINNDNNNNYDSTKILLLIKCILIKIDISFNDVAELYNSEIKRDLLLSDELKNYCYSLKDEIKKTGLSSSKHTSLQSNSIEKQQFPAVNTLRQLLKAYKLKLKPYVRSLGYEINTGKKITERYYLICPFS